VTNLDDAGDAGDVIEMKGQLVNVFDVEGFI
jgi:hypothetical protein